MGVDKASMPIGGVPSASRVLAVLRQVADPVLEVGPGRSGAPSVLEDQPGSGPLVALAAGAGELARRGCFGPVLVVACDLPLLDRAVLHMLATWPGDGSVVPVVEGRPQPLCARWARAELEAAVELAARGVRALRPLYERPGVVLAPEDTWPPSVDPAALADADTPEDLVRMGLLPPSGRPPG